MPSVWETSVEVGELDLSGMVGGCEDINFSVDLHDAIPEVLDGSLLLHSMLVGD